MASQWDKMTGAVIQRLGAPRILTGAKGFEGAGAVAAPDWNRAGLHRWRVERAARTTAARRAALAAPVPADWRTAFDSDGFVMVRDAMPAPAFAAMKEALLGREWPVREMTQGDTITRRAAVNGEMLRAVPDLAAFLARSDVAATMRYVSGFDIEPLHYVQTILKRPTGAPDPQTALHADTFHSSMKAWLFLDDVDADEGAFTFVPGSHRATPERLDWEQRQVEEILAGGGDRMSRRGSFRLDEEGRAAMGLPPERRLACPANTLVIADTFGFHARGPSTDALNRVEIWSFSRRNPFLPWTGGDPLSARAVAHRRMDWLWRVRDRWPRLFKQPWKPVGERYLDADHEGRRP